MTYCFLDIETTGLDENRDRILEIAWVFTDKDFSMLSNAQFLVEQANWADSWSRINVNEIVANMHSQSGLLAALANDDLPKTDLDDIYLHLASELEDASRFGEPIHLAGRSVHFDKGFLVANNFDTLFNDKFSNNFHHRMLDISSVKLMLESSGVDTKQFEVESAGAHRAMNDVLGDIGYARNLQSFFQSTAVSL